jgi:hypothetical protein
MPTKCLPQAKAGVGNHVIDMPTKVGIHAFAVARAKKP